MALFGGLVQVFRVHVLDSVGSTCVAPPPRATKNKNMSFGVIVPSFFFGCLNKHGDPSNPHKSIMSCPPPTKNCMLFVFFGGGDPLMFEAGPRGSHVHDAINQKKKVTCYTPLSSKGSSFKKRRGWLVYQYIPFTIFCNHPSHSQIAKQQTKTCLKKQARRNLQFLQHGFDSKIHQPWLQLNTLQPLA